MQRSRKITVAALAAGAAAAALIVLSGQAQYEIPANLSPEVREDVAELSSIWPSTRGAAATRLGLRADIAGTVAPFLIDRLDDRGPAQGWISEIRNGVGWHTVTDTVSLRSIKALISLGGPAVPALLEGLHHPRDAVRQTVCGVLGEMGAASAAGALRSTASSDASEDVRRSARRSLAQMRDPMMLDFLHEQLKSPLASERREAALHLGVSGSSHATEALIDTLDDEDPEVRGASLAALQRITKQLLGAEATTWRRWLEEERGRGDALPRTRQ